MIACYILYSSSLNRFYPGITQESVESRLEKHNNSSYGNRYTSQAKDWVIFLEIPCTSVAQRPSKGNDVIIARLKLNIRLQRIFQSGRFFLRNFFPGLFGVLRCRVIGIGGR